MRLRRTRAGFPRGFEQVDGAADRIMLARAHFLGRILDDFCISELIHASDPAIFG